MTYRARRTRDLQGEVKAGTGISVSESIKQDGTKVYTLENTEPGSKFFTTERTEGGWAILNQDNNIVLASSSEFTFNKKGITFFTKDGEPFAIVNGTKSNGNQAFTILDASGRIDLVSLSQNGIKLRYDNIDEEGTNIYAGQITLFNNNGNTNIDITTTDIYIYNNDEGNDNLIIEHSDDCKLYIRNRYGNDGLLIETYDDNIARISICDADGNEVLHSDSLVDMVNSACFVNVYDLIYGGGGIRLTTALSTSYNWITEPNNIRSDDYYDFIDSGLIINGTEVGGIEFRHSGFYEITINANFYISQVNSGLERNIVIRRNNQTINIPYLSTKLFYWNADGYLNYSETFYLELFANDILVPYFENADSSGDMGTIDGFNITMKRVR